MDICFLGRLNLHSPSLGPAKTTHKCEKDLKAMAFAQLNTVLQTFAVFFFLYVCIVDRASLACLTYLYMVTTHGVHLVCYTGTDTATAGGK